MTDRSIVPPALPTGRLHFLQALGVAAALSACGGAVDTAPQASVAMAPASAVTTLQLDMPPLPDAAAAFVARPMFNLAPTLLAEPDQSDTGEAHRAPHTRRLSTDQQHLSTRRLTVQAIREADRQRAIDEANGVDTAAAQAEGVSVAPMASGAVVATYTPAQIRAAYGLPPLPAAGAVLSASQRAQLGAGQTIYIVDAMHDPNAAAELAAFNVKFGLPACTVKPIAVNQALPLAAASPTACEFSVVYNTAAGAMTAVAPAYNSGWATEIALDVQWAHATAPLARIVLIEAADASLNSLIGAVKLANAMGPGVVSMSFGANEGNWTASVDAAFSGANMTYLAATGDNGAAVSWPAVSPKVVAVGGTTLSYSGTGTRSEVSWSGTGGGTSAYTPTPTYQNSTIPGVGTPLRRTVADVAFNADPSSGQYVAVMTPGSTSPNWVSAGGTSLSTPQWAGLVALANAMRALSAKAPLGMAHTALYGQIGAVPMNYTSAFTDITKGSNGACATCVAKAGYDSLAGLGTPNVTSLLQLLSGATVTPVAPVVTGAGIAGKVGTPLSFTVAASASNALTYTLSGAPSGMTINSAGVVSWAVPLAGTYTVTALVRDSVTGATGQGVYTVTIAPPAAPVVSAGAISGKVGTALSFSVSASGSNLSWSLTGAPSGMTIASTGVVSWPTPLAGTYAVTAIATDSKTKLSGKAVYTVAIAAPLPPVVSAASLTGRPGIALSFGVSVVAPNAVTYSLTGAPSGMTISSAGLLAWTKPVLGSYSVTVAARDSKTGLSGKAVIAIKIAAAGPVITVVPLTGVAGKAFSGSFGVAAPGASWLSVSIAGAPAGMSFGFNGTSILMAWARPVTGSYTLTVVATDSAGLIAKASVPITITAK
jgi:hypothetical protein